MLQWESYADQLRQQAMAGQAPGRDLAEEEAALLSDEQRQQMLSLREAVRTPLGDDPAR